MGDGVPAAPTLAAVAESWSAEVQLGEGDVGTRAAAAANAAAGLTEAVTVAEATTEAAVLAGDAADAVRLAEAEVNVAQQEAISAETGAPAGQAEASALELEEQTAQAQANSDALAETKATLTTAAEQAIETVGPGNGPVYGTNVHTAFEAEVNALGN